MGRASRTDRSERTKDMVNVEAWAEVFKEVLYLLPEEIRAEVLTLVVQNDEAERKEVEANAGLGKSIYLSKSPDDTPGLRYWNAIMRLKSLVIQVLTRCITNNHSPEEAAKLLFAEHPHGHGSGWIVEYLDGLPGIKVDKARIIALIGRSTPCQPLMELRE
jgi:hypothetical protein